MISPASLSESSTVKTRSGVFMATSLERRRLVQDHPIQLQGPHRLGKLVEINRLADVTVGSQVITHGHILLFPGGGEDHNRDAFGQVMAADTFQNLQAIKLGQL